MTGPVGGGERLDLLGWPLPPWLEVRVVVLPPGDRLGYEPTAWHGALLEVDCGELDLEFDGGACCRLGAGTLFWLDGLAPEALHNLGTSRLSWWPYPAGAGSATGTVLQQNARDEETQPMD